MAGTLTISTLSDGTNSTSSTNCIKGSAKAWVNFNGVTTATIRASYNTSSITRNASGDYTVNFTNALVDANYCVQLTSGSSSASVTNRSFNTAQSSDTSGPTSKTTTAVRVLSGQTGLTDMGDLNVAIFR